MPELVSLQERYSGRVAVLAVNVFESKDQARLFADKQGYPLTYVFADDLAHFLGVQVLPSKVLLDHQGRIIWAGVGHVPIATHLMLERHL